MKSFSQKKSDLKHKVTAVIKILKLKHILN